MNQLPLISTSDAINPLFLFIYGACLVLLLGITITMLYFVVRYHRSRAPEPTSQVDGNLMLEIIWIVRPSLLVLAMFWYGWKEYLVLRTVPPNAIAVTATAQMWSWNFSYADGKTSNKLYVPVGKAVRVELVSKDVIHGFFIPAFRVKRDIVPGMSNYVWFVANKPGSYDVFCSQYCGTQHSAMITTVEAVPVDEFATWLTTKQAPGVGGNRDGKALAEEKGCLGCHSLDGTPGVGPSFKGIMGRSEVVITKGAEHPLTVDETYLRRSITEPGADVVKGFQPIMPEFGDLKKDELDALVKFVISVK